VAPEEALGGHPCIHPSFDHGFEKKARDAAAGKPCTQDDDPLVGERHPSDGNRGQERACCDGCGALNVVIEGTQPVSIPLEEACGVCLGEVLPSTGAGKLLARVRAYISRPIFLPFVGVASLQDANRKAGRDRPPRSWDNTGGASRMERADLDRKAPCGKVAS
jgi:hypothetical protein